MSHLTMGTEIAVCLLFSNVHWKVENTVIFQISPKRFTKKLKLIKQCSSNDNYLSVSNSLLNLKLLLLAHKLLSGAFLAEENYTLIKFWIADTNSLSLSLVWGRVSGRRRGGGGREGRWVRSGVRWRGRGNTSVSVTHALYQAPMQYIQKAKRSHALILYVLLANVFLLLWQWQLKLTAWQLLSLPPLLLLWLFCYVSY